ncbi:hypothetical protein F9K79_15240 [Ochrobactrum sp. Kaboul]|nr:hypothetical protein F9K79_15240 [Ochrobactrum sp. Kaboul]
MLLPPRASPCRVSAGFSRPRALERFWLKRNRGTALSICCYALSYASKRDQKSVQWTDFPA